MRITGGQARGIPLKTGRARNIRPATDRMREAVFSSLGERVGGATFLDLFAGVGSYGLEALSRGAAGGLFVEKQSQAVEAIEQNLAEVLKSIGISGPPPCRTICRDVLRFSSSSRFDLIFMDAPYDLARTHLSALLEKVRGLLNPKNPSLLVLEIPGDLQMAFADWSCLRRIGRQGNNDPSVVFLEPCPQ